MEPKQLLRRDLPLEPGRMLRFTFTIAYEVPVDEDLVPDGAASLSEIEETLGSNDDAIWRTLHQNCDREVIEHVTTLADVHRPGEMPFELEWEAEVRERGSSAGDALLRSSRRWFETIPAPDQRAPA
jgi:hypothetical protein